MLIEITPTEYDVVVIGTGITECIIAAACSRIGKTVLHLDCNKFYGEQWSSFTLSCLEKLSDESIASPGKLKYNHFLHNLKLINLLKNESENNEIGQIENNDIGQTENNEIGQTENNETGQTENNETGQTENSAVNPSCDADNTDSDNANKPQRVWSEEKFNKNKRRINIDITPKLCYSNGPMVELLRSSNCSRYLEFKAVNRSFVHHNGELITAPCSREQVFNSKHLKILEKRLMMKFVSYAVQSEEDSTEFEEWSKKTDKDLYESFKLTDSLVRLIKSSLVISNKKELSAQETLKASKLYLTNVGIYGHMPYIFPVYGAGELPQAFARFSAVFGSIYVLDMMVNELNFEETGEFGGVTLSTEQRISGKFCVLSPNYQHLDLSTQSDDNLITISHAVVLMDNSIQPKTKIDEQDDISIIHILPGCLENPHPVSGYEFGPGSYVPAQEMYMLHLTTTSSSESPEADLDHVLNSIIPTDDNTTNILYKVFFTTKMTSETPERKPPQLSHNIVCTSYPTYNSAYKEAIVEAREAFQMMYPGEEFLPAAPNPEDIKWVEDEDENETKKPDENDASDALRDSDNIDATEASEKNVATEHDTADDNAAQRDAPQTNGGVGESIDSENQDVDGL